MAVDANLLKGEVPGEREFEAGEVARLLEGLLDALTAEARLAGDREREQ
jgi:hypothetical protein